jgi:hypothetical protein
MSRCEVRIALDRPAAVFRPGEPVTGAVRLRGDGGARIRKVTVALEWRTSGKGNQAKGGREEVVVGEDVAIRPTADTDLRFDLTAPHEPWTYSGEVLAIDWYVCAEADVAWARDAKADQVIRLEPVPPTAEAVEPYIRAVRVADLPAAARDRLDSVADASSIVGAPQVNVPRGVVWGFVGCFTLFFGLPLLFSLIASLIAVLSGDLTGLIGILVTGMVLALPLGVVGFLYRHRLAERRIGRTSLKLFSQTLSPGDPVQFLLRTAPPRDVKVDSVRAVLSAREIVVKGSGKNQSTYRHTALEQATSLESASLPGGEDMVFVGRIDVPPAGPCSFRTTSNRIEWRLEVEIDIPGWPNWKRRVPVEVTPRTAPAPAAAG